eukprot:3948622-Pyramimonas_sp.AAC.1
MDYNKIVTARCFFMNTSCKPQKVLRILFGGPIMGKRTLYTDAFPDPALKFAQERGFWCTRDP